MSALDRVSRRLPRGERVPCFGPLSTRACGLIPGVLLTILLLLALSCSQNGFSITVEELIAKIEAKSKGFDARVKDITIQVEAAGKGEDGEKIALGKSKIWRKGGKFRIEGTFKAPGMGRELSSTLISNGEELWTVIPSVGKMKMPQTGISSSQYADWSRLIPEDAKLIGKEKVGKRSAYKITFSDSLMNYEVWVDTKRLVPLKVATQSIEGGFPSTTILYKSYKKVEGIWGIPYIWEIYMNEELFTTTKVKSVEVNSDLSLDLFDPSKIEEKELDAQELMKKLGAR